MSEFHNMLDEMFGDTENVTKYTVCVRHYDGYPNTYEGIVSTEVGESGELYVVSVDDSVTIYASGQWTRVESVPMVEDGVECG